MKRTSTEAGGKTVDNTTTNGTKVSLKAYFDEKLTALERRFDAKTDERDKRYDVMFTSIDTAIAAALAAQEKAVAAALAAQEKAVYAAAEASEKAIAKAEIAQMGVNVRGNEFRASLDDYTKLMMPRPEASTRFDALSERFESVGKQIVELREIVSRSEGRAAAATGARVQSNWVIGIVVVAGLNFIGLVVGLVYFISQRH